MDNLIANTIAHVKYVVTAQNTDSCPILPKKIILQQKIEFQLELMAELYMQTHYISNDKNYNLYRKGLDIDIRICKSFWYFIERGTLFFTHSKYIGIT